jgi:hypothetical protein
LGFSDAEIERWFSDAGLGEVETRTLPPETSGGLTVKIWRAARTPSMLKAVA